MDYYEYHTIDDCKQHIKQLIDFYFEKNNIFILSEDFDYLDESTIAELYIQNQLLSRKNTLMDLVIYINIKYL